MIDNWFVTQLSPHAPGLWLILSLLVGLLLSLFARNIPPNWREPALLLRWGLVPYLGLLLGGLSPRLMGLTDLDWSAALGLGLGLIFAIIALLTCVYVAASLGENDEPGLPSPAPPHHPLKRERRPRFQQFLYSGAEQFHWVFLRGALWEMLQTSPARPELSVYWAVWMATLLAAPEAILQTTGAIPRLFKTVLLLTTSILFLYTRNFWLCWLLHGTIWLIFAPQDGTAIAHQAPAYYEKLPEKVIDG